MARAKSAVQKLGYSGFQMVWLKLASGALGVGWMLVQCGRDCAISSGCKNCPVMFTDDAPAKSRFLVERLMDPFKLKVPRVVFVAPEGDLFHCNISMENIAKVFATMEQLYQHTFVIVTKRADRMAAVLSDPSFAFMVTEMGRYLFKDEYRPAGVNWGEHIWIGVSVENQKAVERVGALAELPGTMNPAIFVSPQVEHIVVGDALKDVRWVVNNKEVGSWGKKRPCPVEWRADLKKQCEKAGVPYYLSDRHSEKLVRQMGSGIRQFPKGFLR